MPTSDNVQYVNCESIVLQASESLSAANVKPYNGTDYTMPDPSRPPTPTADHAPPQAIVSANESET